MQYPVLTTNQTLFLPNPSFTIVPIVSTSVFIDNFPVITSFTWTNNSSGASGTIMGNSTSLLSDSLPVVLLDATVIPYYTLIGVANVLSD